MNPSFAQSCLKSVNGSTYLEVGVAGGRSFYPIQAKNKFGVDPAFRITKLKQLRRKLYGLIRGMNIRLFPMTSDDFFNSQRLILKRNPPDVIVVDGLHTYEQSLKDTLHAFTFLKPGGFVLLDDCNPQTETMAYPAAHIDEAKSLNLPGWDGNWCGDVWKTIVYLRSQCPDLEVFVIDQDFGIGVARKGKPESILNDSVQDISQMTYSHLEANRKHLLNLKPASYFGDFLSNNRF